MAPQEPDEFRGLQMSEKVAVLYERVRNLTRDVEDVSAEMRGVRRAMWSLVAALVVVAVSVALTGRVHP